MQENTNTSTQDKFTSKEYKLTNYTNTLTFMGYVISINDPEGSFRIKCRSGNEFVVYVKGNTVFQSLKNLDELDRDRMPNPEGFDWNKISDRIRKYIYPGHLVYTISNYMEDGDINRMEAREIYLLQSSDGEYLFEDTHWGITQIAALSDTWLENLFGSNGKYDFSKYRTNLDITGFPPRYGGDTIQETATLSRLLYGLSSAYLLTGCQRYLDAAKEGVIYQREHFRSLSHDGRYCFWAFGKRDNRMVIASENSDDKGAIPLYEQIYALAGLAQYYRITQDWEVLEDIERTIYTFNEFFLDKSEYGGYFSHIDAITLKHDSDALLDSDKDNRNKKNWNSIGDHIPAYLINLLIAIDPIPIGKNGKSFQKLVEDCKELLYTTTKIIVEKFPEKENKNIPFVNEKFNRDWSVDHTWRWQQNRAVIGHNLKIAWNLTRVANYYYDKDRDFANQMMEQANKLGRSMAEVGVDQFRGGVFDVVERDPKNGMKLEFPWGNTKDFWQQEQAILAYQILYGYEKDEEYLKLARENIAFWNLFFLDHDRKNIFFRTAENGMPVITGSYGNKGGHSISGYHAFELNYLAHIYTMAYIKRKPFCLFFKPSCICGQTSINVLPDFMKPDEVRITRMTIDGIARTNFAPDIFQVELSENEIKSNPEVVVEFMPKQN